MVDYFMDFFVEESCGYCTPCRVGNVLLKRVLEKVIDGKGEASDLELLKSLGTSVKTASRCGLGQTSPNPILTTLERFPEAYEALIATPEEGKRPSFDLGKVLEESSAITGRKPVHLS